MRNPLPLHLYLAPPPAQLMQTPLSTRSTPQGLFELAAKTYAARRSMQGSMDGGAADEFVLADILAAELSAAATGLSVASSSGSSGSNGAAPKAKPPPAGKRNQLPGFRSEIDEW